MAFLPWIFGALSSAFAWVVAHMSRRVVFGTLYIAGLLALVLAFWTTSMALYDQAAANFAIPGSVASYIGFFMPTALVPATLLVIAHSVLIRLIRTKTEVLKHLTEG